MHTLTPFLLHPPRAHLLCDVIVTGVNAVPEQVLSAAVTAAEVTVVHELPAGVGEGMWLQGPSGGGVQTQAMGWGSLRYPSGPNKEAALTQPGQETIACSEAGRGAATCLPDPLAAMAHR